MVTVNWRAGLKGILGCIFILLLWSGSGQAEEANITIFENKEFTWVRGPQILQEPKTGDIIYFTCMTFHGDREGERIGMTHRAHIYNDGRILVKDENINYYIGEELIANIKERPVREALEVECDFIIPFGFKCYSESNK